MEEDLLVSTNPESVLFDRKFEEPPQPGVPSAAVPCENEPSAHSSHVLEVGAQTVLWSSLFRQRPRSGLRPTSRREESSLVELAALPLGWLGAGRRIEALSGVNHFGTFKNAVLGGRSVMSIRTVTVPASPESPRLGCSDQTGSQEQSF